MKLKDIGIIITGNTPSKKNEEYYGSNDILFVKPSDIKEDYITFIEKSEGYISEKARAKVKILPKGAVLVTCIGTIGKVGILNREAICNQQINAIIPNDKVISKYLAYLIQSKQKLLQSKANAPVVPIINKSDFSEIEVNICSIDKQKEIVEQLDLIKTIIDERTIQINGLQDIIKSQFVEMFNGIKEKKRLGECCKIHARIGWQSLTKDEHMRNGEYMLITGTDFKNNEVEYEKCVYVTKERYEMDEHIILKNNDILITKDGTIGKVAIVHNLNKPATLNSGIFVVRPDNRFNKEYIAYVFLGPMFEEFVDRSKTGATIKHLNQKHLLEFEIPVPPIELQNQFAEIVQQIDKQKFEEMIVLENELKQLQENIYNEWRKEDVKF